MTTNRYDQDPNENHGYCLNCGLDLPTEQDGADHRNATFEEAKAAGGNSGHRTRTINPSRPQRIRREIESLIEDAIQSALSRIDSAIAEDDITEEEATEALKWVDVDLAEAWEEYTE